MTKIIPFDHNLEETNKLERAQLEVIAKESILYLMINNNQKNSIYYKEIWEDYIESLKNLTNIRNQYYNMCVRSYAEENNAIDWFVDFERKELILSV